MPFIVNRNVDRKVDYTPEGLASIAGFGISTEATRDLVKAHPQYAITIALALHSLAYDDELECANVDSEFLVPENLALLGKHAQYAAHIALGLRTLKDGSLLTPDNRAILDRYAQHADAIARGLVLLRQSGLLTPENCKLIIEYRDFINDIMFTPKQIEEATQQDLNDIIQNIDRNLQAQAEAFDGMKKYLEKKVKEQIAVSTRTRSIKLFFDRTVKTNLTEQIFDFLPRRRNI